MTNQTNVKTTPAQAQDSQNPPSKYDRTRATRMQTTNTSYDPNEINTKSFNKSVQEYAKYFLWPIEERLVREYFTGKVLDLGAGCGRTTVKLHEMGFEVIGTDIAKDMIAHASKKFPHIQWKVVDASKLPFADESFDTVFFSYCGIDYLHPLTKRAACFREVFRVLRHNGVFVFSSHNAFSPLTHIGSTRRIRATLHNKKLNGYRTEKTSEHPLITYFSTPRENLRHLKEAGFTRNRIIDGIKGILLNTKPYYVGFKP